MSHKAFHLSEELVPPSSDILNQVASEVTPEDFKHPKLQVTIDVMLRVAKGQQGNPSRPTLVGLAAPQIGVIKRIILVGVDATGMGEEPTFKIFINPIIIEPSNRIISTVLSREGCYSTGRVCGIVERAQEVTISALDRSGMPLTETYKGSSTGFPANIFQHEIDHLNGIRFPDRIKKKEYLHWVEPEEFGKYRVEWLHWPNLCSRERWRAIKQGIES